MNVPAAFGRSVVLAPGAPCPDPWVGCAEIVVEGSADPDVVDRLHRAWVTRTPVVIRLGIGDVELAEPEQTAAAPWELGGGFTFLRERTHFLVWANSYDGRRDPPVWWWGKKAERLGAGPGTDADIIMPDGEPAWVDGGPRGDASTLGIHPVVHAESILDGSLVTVPGAPVPAPGGLAADQAAAVLHGPGAARVIAPAGSGKTRTLASRLERVVRGLGYTSVRAVAYNNRAARELTGRVGSDLGPAVSTLHSLGRSVLFDAAGPLELASERDVRRLLEPMVPAMRRPNTDIIGPYIEALSEVRIALADPREVEAGRDDVPGFVDVFKRYRKVLRARGTHDFDEQIYGAIEALLLDPDLRRRWQAANRHLLVDEFQDLTPAYLLLIRLLSSPGLDVFGVGDDDQVIYGYAGADPGFLIDFDSLFPGAGHHALEVNYRCPRPVVESATRLLRNGQRRIDKEIVAFDRGDSGYDVTSVPGSRAAPEAGRVISTWLEEGCRTQDMVVLCRVNSALLPVHAWLVENSLPFTSPIGPAVLDRTVMSAALAWIRVALDPDQIARDDVFSIIRRPSRGLGRVASELLGRSRSVSLASLRDARRNLDGRQRDRWERFVSDIERAVRVARDGDAVALIDTLSHDVGLTRAAEALDSGRTRADRSNQSDDLRALRRAAVLHPNLDDFEPWLRSVVAAPHDRDGVLLTTVHKVKGLEWDRVIVYGADTGTMPHELATDLEEERRVFHVAITRARREVVVISDQVAPSRFVAEAAGAVVQAERPDRKPRELRGIGVAVGERVGLAGGYGGVVERMLPIGVLVALEPGPGRLSVQWGETVTVGGASGPLTPTGVEADPRLLERLKEWRRGVSKANGVPAYVVLNDESLSEVARRRPRTEEELLAVKGIGPAKLEAYGDDLLDLVAD